MAVRKLVSTVTGTWARHDLLFGMIENIRAQTYRPLEMVIVSDGPDPVLREKVEAVRDASDVPIVFVELGRNWSTFLTNSFSAAPFMTAQLVARGDYQCWWADDERALVPDHIEKLVSLIEQYDADFAYPQVELTWPNSSHRTVIGSNPPINGQITHCLYTAVALDMGMLFRTHVGTATDWDAIARVMSTPGARWAFLRECTFTHEVNHG